VRPELDGRRKLAIRHIRRRHTVIEAARPAFADRHCELGDWEHVAVPLEGLLHPAYPRQVAQSITPGQASLHIDGHAEP
jgi:gamma-glutamyltranspeptidase